MSGISSFVLAQNWAVSSAVAIETAPKLISIVPSSGTLVFRLRCFQSLIVLEDGAGASLGGRQNAPELGTHDFESWSSTRLVCHV